ncbi:hypothetical protein [Hymenobacter amundsenii]|uniref:hypothetical protein n=1 Tax=Hymenobacter amundsenii TaxID=2006685 RepID=UPI000F81CD05|nr:hypothetical protein [Hymenobacter amundsenii]
MLPLLLAVLLTVLALRRPDTRRRGLRVGAGLLAAAGLGLAALPPVTSRPSTAPPATAVLLTAGYSPDTLADLLRRLGPGVPVWRYAPGNVTPNDTPAFRNASAIRAKLPGLRQLHVLGTGVPPTDAPALAGLRVHRHADARPMGFQQSTWNAQPELGQLLTVTGTFTGAKTWEPVWLSLRAAGAARDSVQLPKGMGAFALRFRPRAAGRAVYMLEARQSGRRLAQEPVPVEVQDPEPLRVLLLAAAPSFELRFLKNHLAERQYAVALRTGLSRGLTQTEFLNLPNPPALGSLTPALLRRFDVVVTDAATLAGFSSAETRALQAALNNGTSGLLLLADAPTLPRQLPGGAAFRLQPQPAAAAATPQRLSWPEGPTTVTALVPATLRLAEKLRPLITGPNRQPVAATRRVGLGTVVVSTVAETFPWQLRNQPAIYTAYWSRLLGAARPGQPTPLSVAALNHWPHPNAPLEFRTTGAAAGPLSITPPTGPALALAQRPDALVSEWRTATYWPAVAGWHRAQVGKAQQWVYVYAPRQWRGPGQQQWPLAARQPAGTAASVGPATNLGAPERTAWPRWWGYAVFLLGAGLLWLEEKL